MSQCVCSLSAAHSLTGGEERGSKCCFHKLKVVNGKKVAKLWPLFTMKQCSILTIHQLYFHSLLRTVYCVYLWICLLKAKKQYCLSINITQLQSKKVSPKQRWWPEMTACVLYSESCFCFLHECAVVPKSHTSHTICSVWDWQASGYKLLSWFPLLHANLGWRTHDASSRITTGRRALLFTWVKTLQYDALE